MLWSILRMMGWMRLHANRSAWMTRLLVLNSCPLRETEAAGVWAEEEWDVEAEEEWGVEAEAVKVANADCKKSPAYSLCRAFNN